MASIYRIPLTVKDDKVAWIDDLDLPLLLAHSGEKRPVSVKRLAAYDVSLRQWVVVQCLPSAAPSALPGQWCCTLLIDPERRTRLPGVSERIHLYVDTGISVSHPERQAAWATGMPDNEIFSRSPDLLNQRMACLMPFEAFARAPAGDVQIKEMPDTLDVAVAGKPFVTYRFNTKDPEVPRPYFHPVVGPAGKPITQMGEVPGKKEKHFHHTALWIAHQNFGVKGQPPCDNWQIGRPNSSRIEHVKFDAVESGPLAGRFVERLRWLNVKGDQVLLAETRTITIPKRPEANRVLDVDLVLTGSAEGGQVTLNKTPYHILAVRVLDALLPARGGAITNSEGKKNPADGMPARWIDISGPLDGTWQGVALFNHPGNFRQPTPCLQFAGQTIGLSPTHQEPYTIEPGKVLRLRFRVLVHAGNVEEGKVAAEYETYSKPGQARIDGPERLGCQDSDPDTPLSGSES